MIEILGAAVASFLLVVFATPVMRRIAKRFGILRAPGGRHWHTTSTPLWGGAALLLVIISVIAAHPALVVTPQITAVLTGLALVLVVGLLDDRREMPWWLLLGMHMSAAGLLLLGGVRLWYMSGIGGGALRLDQFVVHLPQALCLVETCALPVLGSLLLVVWVVAVMNAINWSDGSDGVASSVSFLGLAVLALLSFRSPVLQPPISIIAAAGAGASAGFLPYNLPNARIFLGSAGSFGLGFLLAALAVIAGTKLATVGMVLVVPAADALAVVFVRLFRHRAVVRGDTLHLHHILRLRGWSPRAVLALHIGASVVFGTAALLLPRPVKITILATGFFAMVILFVKMKLPYALPAQH